MFLFKSDQPFARDVAFDEPHAAVRMEKLSRPNFAIELPNERTLDTGSTILAVHLMSPIALTQSHLPGEPGLAQFPLGHFGHIPAHCRCERFRPPTDWLATDKRISLRKQASSLPASPGLRGHVVQQLKTRRPNYGRANRSHCVSLTSNGHRVYLLWLPGANLPRKCFDPPLQGG